MSRINNSQGNHLKLCSNAKNNVHWITGFTDVANTSCRMNTLYWLMLVSLAECKVQGHSHDKHCKLKASHANNKKSCPPAKIEVYTVIMISSCENVESSTALATLCLSNNVCMPVIFMGFFFFFS